MDGTIRLMDGKPWRCKNGHLLGVMRRERIGSYRGYRVYILTRACTINPLGDMPLEWKSRAEGTVDVLCEVCGTCNTWWASQAAMDSLLDSRHKNGRSDIAEAMRESV